MKIEETFIADVFQNSQQISRKSSLKLHRGKFSESQYCISDWAFNCVIQELKFFLIQYDMCTQDPPVKHED